MFLYLSWVFLTCFFLQALSYSTYLSIFFSKLCKFQNSNWNVLYVMFVQQTFFSQLHFKVRALPLYLIFWKIFHVSFDITSMSIKSNVKELFSLKNRSFFENRTPFYRLTIFLVTTLYCSNKRRRLTRRQTLYTYTEYAYACDVYVMDC